MCAILRGLHLLNCKVKTNFDLLGDIHHIFLGIKKILTCISKNGTGCPKKRNGNFLFRDRVLNPVSILSLGGMNHGRALRNDEGRFWIIKVMKDAYRYPKFDEDVHCVGTTVTWKLNQLEQISTPFVHRPGTEEEVPRLRDASPLKKHRPETWEQNIRKRKINSGKRHEHTVKKGKDKGKKRVVEAKKMKTGCKAGECRMGCTEDFGEEERLKIFKAFYKLKTIDEKRNFLIQRVKRKAP